MLKYRIKDFREDFDYYQKDIAKILNITQQQYSNIENELSVITAEDLIKLANLYHVSVDYILKLTSNDIPYEENNKSKRDKVTN